MLQFFVLALAAWCASVYTTSGQGLDDTASAYTLKVKELDMVRVGEAMELYRQETGAMPPDLQTLAATAGYEYLAPHLSGWQTYRTSGSLTDGTWTFSRVVAFALAPGSGTAAAYLAQNSCGNNAFDVDTGSWCGTLNSRWYVMDSRNFVKREIFVERAKLTRLSEKFANYFSTVGNYPTVDAANNPLGASSITSLASLVGYSGTAKTCSGQYQYAGIPIDCNDMFDVWGGPIGYQFESAAHVIFVSEPPIYDGAGNRIVVAVDRA